MKTFNSLILLSGALSSVVAFPAASLNVPNADITKPIPLDKLKAGLGALDSRSIPDFEDLLQQVEALVATTLTGDEFNADRQRVDVSGEHAFQMPDYAAGDVRGPCPGLNVLANHGYLPRNGVATILEYATAVQKVLGMGIDTALVLGVYGTVLGGNPVSLTPGVSMGGPSNAPEAQNLLGNLLGLMGKPKGLTGTHNIFEVDSSITRSDLYDADGDNNNMNMDYFMDLYNMQKDAEVPHYTLDVFLDHALVRFNQSIATNPSFYYGPWSGWFVRNAAYCFAARIFGNASEEYPNGFLDKETLKSFWGVTGPEDNMTYTKGAERIPDNYYRRATDYAAADLWVDIIENVSLKRPTLLSIGGNTNGVNTFTGVNLENLTGGIMNAEYLAQGNNALCFAFQILQEGAPSVVGSIYATAEPVLTFLLDAINLPLTSLACRNDAYKQLGINGVDFLKTLKTTYPGAAKSGVFL
ncbi:oxidase protein [Rutstroemia sp. NJR-2017a WRK4]|nr:oxidase protein [Rutstroemia sp. NJR-2017a WRK4]